MPFGEERTDVGTWLDVDDSGFTDLGYTGQRNYASFGLMDYHARFYSPALGRFTQPDTVIPSLTNTQSWNRFSYVNNSPILYNDPGGHWPEFFQAVADAVTHFAAGVVGQVALTLVSSIPGTESITDQTASGYNDINDTAFQVGRLVGAMVAGVVGINIAITGAAGITGGAAACATGVLCPAGAAAIAGSVAMTAGGAIVALQAIVDGITITGVLLSSAKGSSSGGNDSIEDDLQEKSPWMGRHARRNLKKRRWTEEEVLDVANNPTGTVEGRTTRDGVPTIHLLGTNKDYVTVRNDTLEIIQFNNRNDPNHIMPLNE
jgi:RHS repeat-associated protein